MNLQEYFVKQKSQPRRKKGRNEELLQRRDRKLALRFYYYAHLKQLSYRDTISALMVEFDICERVVLDRLRANQDYLDSVFAEKPPISKLQRTIPYFNW